MLIADVGSSLLSGDVLKHDAQSRMAAAQRDQVLVDEGRFPIKNIHLRIGDLAMNEQRHVDGFHALQHRGDPSEITHTGRRIGGGIGGIELRRGEHSLAKPTLQLIGIKIVGEISGHQRFELQSLRKRRKNPAAVSERSIDRGDRRTQIGHHDGPGKGSGRGWQHGLKHRSVPQVHMPVIRTAEHK